MIKLDLRRSASSQVTGTSYVYVSEPDKVGNILARLSKYNLNRLNSISPENTNRFTSMFFNPLLEHMRIKRGTLKGSKPTTDYVKSILNHIADEAVVFATVAEVAARVSTSVKEADAFMTAVVTKTPLLTPFSIEVDEADTNQKIFTKLAGVTLTTGIAKKVIDGLTFPKEGVKITPERVTLAGIAATFTAKPSRPMTRREVIQSVDDIFAFYALTKEIEDSSVVGATNCAMALHIILDVYLSLLGPDSSAMSSLHQELAGQSSVVSLDVIRRVTSSFATVGLTAYLGIPSLRLLHIAELAEMTANVTKKHVPASEVAYVSTTQTLELLKGVRSMMTPYLMGLYDLSGSNSALQSSLLFDNNVEFLPPVFKSLISIPESDMVKGIDGPLPLHATMPIKIQTITRSEYLSIASDLENAMTQYRGHVMNYNVVIAQYFNNAELGLLPLNTSSAAMEENTPNITTEWATPFSSPSSIRPVKYGKDGKWTMEKYINRPHNMYDIIRDIIADQPIRFVFDAKGDRLPALGGSQGARFLSLPIPGAYASFTERYAMKADITSFLDLLATQANITTRDSFFEDLSLLLLFARGTDDFIHLYRALAPYLMIDIDISSDKGISTGEGHDERVKSLNADLDLTNYNKVLMGWGVPILLLNKKQKTADAKSKPSASMMQKVTVTDPATKAAVTFSYAIRTQYPEPQELTLVRVDKFAKSVLTQPVAVDFCNHMEITSLISAEEDNFASAPSLTSVLSNPDLEKTMLSFSVKWIESLTYYHEPAAAPHILLRTSQSFSQAFNYTPSDVKSMLVDSIIISDDAEGFTQVFSATRVEPVMIVADDEDSNSFPSLNRGQGSSSSIAPSLSSSPEVVVDSHTDEGRGLHPDHNEARDVQQPIATLDNTNGSQGAGTPADLPPQDVVDNLAGDNADDPNDSPEERERKKKIREEEKAKRALELGNLNKDTMLPNEKNKFKNED